MPFPNITRIVSSLVQPVGKAHFHLLLGKLFKTVEIIACSCCILSRHEVTAACNADRCYCKRIWEGDTLFCKSINVRSLNNWITLKSKFFVMQIIDVDDEFVGPELIFW